MTPTVSPSGSAWPRALIVFFGVFISFIIAFTVFATRQQMELVRPDYYDEEIRFQAQLDRLNHTAAVNPRVVITYQPATRQITVTLPAATSGHSLTGRVRLYRPSDARLDRELALAVGEDGVQPIDARELRPGLWKVRVTWSENGEEFYFDQTLVVGPGPA